MNNEINLKIKYLDWDSEQLGYQCGLIDGTAYDRFPVPTVLKNSIEKLVKQTKEMKFITIKLPASHLEAVNTLVRMGAILLDIELTFAYSGQLSDTQGDSSNDYTYTFCKRFTSEPFLALSSEMRFSRFFLDPNIPNNVANHLWETSIKNHCEGFADNLLVAFFRDEPCGIITIKFVGKQQIFLHIVGVLKKFQGQGVGKFMLNKIIERYAPDHQICIETQSMNIPAQVVYRKAGFSYVALKYILHYWQ